MAIKDRVQGERYKAQGRRRSCLAIWPFGNFAHGNKRQDKGSRYKVQGADHRSQDSGNRLKAQVFKWGRGRVYTIGSL
jgi:hypothetical protein